MVLNPGKCCYMSFGSDPDKSDLILEDSTKISFNSKICCLGSYDRQKTDFLQPSQKPL